MKANDLSHAEPMTEDTPQLPGKPEALPGVGSSNLGVPDMA